jgi:hypothetical protein
MKWSVMPRSCAHAPTIGVLRTVSDCPDYVPPEDCRQATGQERLDIYWAIHDHVNWAIPVCADLGNYAKNLVLSLQDVRVFPHGNGPYYGTWWGQGGQTQQIGFSDKLWQQGWASERGSTGLHEGHHSFYYDSEEDDAQAFETMCINH